MTREDRIICAKDIARAALFVVVFAIVFTLILSAIIYFTSIGDGMVKILSIVSNAIALVMGSIIGIKDKTKGLIKGLIVGLFYVLIAYLIYCVAMKSFSWSIDRAIDAISCIVFGIIGGIISVNIKSK